MQYAFHYKLAANNNGLPLKPFQIFLSGGTDGRKRFLIKAITEYLEQAWRYPNKNLD